MSKWWHWSRKVLPEPRLRPLRPHDPTVRPASVHSHDPRTGLKVSPDSAKELMAMAPALNGCYWLGLDVLQ